MRRANLLIIILLIFLASPFPTEGNVGGADDPVIVMCRPTIDQIKNIAVMRSVGLFGDMKFNLICVYHERELTGYDPSRKYVRDQKLKWISFAELKGKVKSDGLFKENIWTSQFREIFEESDGIIFTGGMDIPPGIYRKENFLMTEATTPYRTMYEASFLFHLIGGSQNMSVKPFLEDKPDYPVLGICLGAQTMNIAAGGTLVQDIPTNIYGLRSVEQVLKQSKNKVHSSRYIKSLFPGEARDISPAFHQIKITPKSILLKKIIGDLKGAPMVLSSHHQSVEYVGEGLYIAASSMDGKIVEALEHEKYKNVLGVQFHPEFRYLHKGLKFFTSGPGVNGFFSLKNFLKKNPPSTEFHRNLWSWFAAEIKR